MAPHPLTWCWDATDKSATCEHPDGGVSYFPPSWQVRPANTASTPRAASGVKT